MDIDAGDASDAESTVSIRSTKRKNSDSEAERTPKQPRPGSSNSTGSTSTIHELPTPQPRIPPLYVDNVVGWHGHAAALYQATSGGFSAHCSKNQYVVKTSNIDNFRAVQKYLTDHKVPFYTRSLPGTRPIKTVIQGLPFDVSNVDIYDALTDMSFGVGDVHKLKTNRGPTNLWVVSLLPDSERDMTATRPPVEIYKLDRLFYVTIKIRPYKKPPGPIQCHRCQDFGHGSSNCGRQTKCVRCGGSHDARNCPKPQGEKGVCCNCGGPHTANYRGCPGFKAEKNRAIAHKTSSDAPAGQTKRPRAGRQAAALPLAERPGPPPPQPPTTTKGGRDTASATPLCSQTADEQGTSEDEDQRGFTATTTRRKRQPRNPANRHKTWAAAVRGDPAVPAVHYAAPARTMMDEEPASVQAVAQPSQGDCRQPQAIPLQQRPTARRAARQPARPTEEARQPTTSLEKPAEVAVLLRTILEQLAAVTAMLQTLATALIPHHG